MDSEPKKDVTDRDHLSIKELSFVDCYTRLGSSTYGLPTESATAAGFAESQAESTGSRFMKDPLILSAIANVHEKLFDDFTASPARVMSDLENAKAMALKKNDRASYIRLVELAGKTQNLWTEKGGLPNKEDDPTPLSEAEIDQCRIITCLMHEDLLGVVEYLRMRQKDSTLYAAAYRSATENNNFNLKGKEQ